MSLNRFRGLSAQKRALVAVAVLLDGREAVTYLGNDSVVGNSLQRAASEIASLDLELRTPLAGTLLREAVEELEMNARGASR